MKFRELRLLPILTLVTLLFALSPTQVSARSGCCSHHGGVCGCGCCDGTSLSITCAPYFPQCSQPIYIAPIATAKPVVYTPKPTIKAVATITPTKTPISTQTPTAKPSPAAQTTESSTPQVQGASTSSSPSPTPAPVTTEGVVGALVILAVIIGLPTWIIIKIVKKFRKPKTEI